MRRRLGTAVAAGCLLATAACGGETSPSAAGSGDDAYVVDVVEGESPQDEPSTSSAEETSTPTPSPSTPPSTTPPQEDRTHLRQLLSDLSPADHTLALHYLRARGEDRLGEGTWISVAPMTVAEARTILVGPDAHRPTRREGRAIRHVEGSAVAFLQVGDGVVAWEPSGFFDPPARLLVALSEDGRAAAYATENNDAMTFFGAARDGRLVYRPEEYAFEDVGDLPAELRPLARLGYAGQGVDLDTATADWFRVAMAMSEKVTGVRATAAVKQAQPRYFIGWRWALER